MHPLTKIGQEHYRALKRMIQTQTLQEIADHFGCSRERVRQILKREFGITRLKRQIIYYCSICERKVILNQKSDKFPYVCVVCSQFKRTHPDGKSSHTRKHEIGPCVRCKNRRGNRRGLCAVCYLSDYYKSPRGKAVTAKYREEHRDKINEKARIRNIILKKEMREYRRAYRLAHVEDGRRRSREYYARNREYMSEYRKQRKIEKLLP